MHARTLSTCLIFCLTRCCLSSAERASIPGDLFTCTWRSKKAVRAAAGIRPTSTSDRHGRSLSRSSAAVRCKINNPDRSRGKALCAVLTSSQQNTVPSLQCSYCRAQRENFERYVETPKNYTLQENIFGAVVGLYCGHRFRRGSFARNKDVLFLYVEHCVACHPASAPGLERRLMWWLDDALCVRSRDSGCFVTLRRCGALWQSVDG